MDNHGLKLLEVLRKQREYFIRLADGTRHITQPMLYHQMEDKAYRLQILIGTENKRIIAKELGCDIRSIYKHTKKECHESNG